MSFAFAHPGHDLPIIEADDQFHLHRDFAAQPFDDADNVRILPSRRHEIDQANGAALGFNFRFKNQRLAPIPAAGCFNFLLRKKSPVPIFLLAKQRRKTCRGIESRKAKPVNAAVATHQRAGLRITEKTVVLDLCIFLRHFNPSLALTLALAPAPVLNRDRVALWWQPCRLPSPISRSHRVSIGTRSIHPSALRQACDKN